jgi:DNA-directed RNA polymerase subunit RPC12/RpoP
MVDYIDTMFRMIDKLNDVTVTCPECGHKQDLTDSYYVEDYVTYWGDEGPKEYQCGSCDHIMMVQERVMRSFDIVENEQ